MSSKSNLEAEFWTKNKAKSLKNEKTKEIAAFFRNRKSGVGSSKPKGNESPSVNTENDEFSDVKDVKKSKKRKRLIVRNDEYSKMMMVGIEIRVPLGLSLYPTQKLMIVRILTALKASQNVLAESPTGSGKTMALLASTCAWLFDYIQRKRAAREKCPIHGEVLRAIKEDNGEVKEEVGDESEDVKDVKPQIATRTDDIFENQWVDDFVPLKGKLPQVKRENSKEPKQETKCICLPRVRVYYGTRTHKQIAQVVKEFSRLPYANLIKHTILGSREQSCINPAARRQPDISQYCKEINSSIGVGCTFKNAMRGRYEKAAPLRDHLQDNGTVVFDIETIVETLATNSPQLCPYFCTNRVLTQDADLIMCPFTYLVDPLIRNSSDVHLENSVVILDEAHNIEDTCRESASFSFTEKELDDSILSIRLKKQLIDAELGKAPDGKTEQIADREIIMKETRTSLQGMENLLLEMLRWMRSVSVHAKTSKNGRDGTKTCTMSQSSLFSSLTNTEQGVDLFTPPETPKYQAISALFGELTKHNEPEMQYFDQFKPSPTAIVTVEKWLYFQSFFGKPEYRATYRLNVSIEPINDRGYFDGNSSMYSDSPTSSGPRRSAGPRNNMYKTESSSWLSESDGDQWSDPSVSQTGNKPISEGCKTTISLWCMSPALSFRDAFGTTRSVILASGTLCPMDTLRTELGMEFKHQVDGKQVISPENIFAAVIPTGPFGNRLQCTFRNTSDPHSSFYREVGDIIRYVCVNIPAGVLCFLPSYRVLEQLKTCMTSSSVMRQIEMKKKVLFEPKRSSDLSAVMDEFDEAIFRPETFGEGINGALMFAVFRGKISEGIDFADDRARVVISVGIPFPNAVDDQVNAKKMYNDQNSKEMGILTGDEWYVTQAYRALNQALGRCLRHKNDWGAMLLIDERLERQAGNLVGGAASARVSKWIRDQLKSYPAFQDFNRDFRRFMERQLGIANQQQPPL